MKNLVLSLLVMMFASSLANADVFVHSYDRKDGTHVKEHYRSNPNDTTLDNWSVKGNVNPYTGESGHRSR